MLCLSSTCFVATVGKKLLSICDGLVFINTFLEMIPWEFILSVPDLSLKTYLKLANKIIVSENLSLFLISFHVILPWKGSRLFGFSSDFYFVFITIYYRLKSGVSLECIRMPLGCQSAWIVCASRSQLTCLWLSTCPWWLPTLWLNSVVSKEVEDFRTKLKQNYIIYIMWLTTPPPEGWEHITKVVWLLRILERGSSNFSTSSDLSPPRFLSLTCPM